jgi:hypothetical protein
MGRAWLARDRDAYRIEVGELIDEATLLGRAIDEFPTDVERRQQVVINSDKRRVN